MNTGTAIELPQKQYSKLARFIGAKRRIVDCVAGRARKFRSLQMEINATVTHLRETIHAYQASIRSDLTEGSAKILPAGPNHHDCCRTRDDRLDAPAVRRYLGGCLV